MSDGPFKPAEVAVRQDWISTLARWACSKSRGPQRGSIKPRPGIVPAWTVSKLYLFWFCAPPPPPPLLPPPPQPHTIPLPPPTHTITSLPVPVGAWLRKSSLVREIKTNSFCIPTAKTNRFIIPSTKPDYVVGMGTMQLFPPPPCRTPPPAPPPPPPHIPQLCAGH